MSRSTILKAAAMVLALVAITGAARAIAYSVRVDACLAWRGEYHWNYASSSQVVVRVQNNSSCTGNVVVQVQARAEDGTTVAGSTYLQLFSGSAREVPVSLSKRITGLQLVQIRWLPSGPNVVCFCKIVGSGGGS